ncbi:MAG: GGDEF domain-containing protein [Pseudomonadota bacterium]
MPRFVSMLAIRSWRDLIVKSLIFYAVFLGLSIPFVVTENDGFSWQSFMEDAWLTILVSTPILVFQFSVVTYLDRLQRQLAELAMTDVLTGLPNRRSFLSRSADALAQSDTGFLVLLDADHFKRINDTYGHAVGDACLHAIASRLNAAVRSSDVVGRLGGEEFGAFMPAATEGRIAAFGTEMTQPITVQHPDVSDDVTVTVSLGAAAIITPEALAGLMSRADAALYEAKKSGRARLAIWRPESEQQSIEQAS